VTASSDGVARKGAYGRLIVVAVVLAWAIVVAGERRKLVEALDHNRELTVEARRLGHFRGALISVLNGMPDQDAHLEGRLVDGAAVSFSHDELSDAIIYRFAYDCPHTGANKAWLNALHASGTAVVGVITNEPEDFGEDHLRDLGLEFPVVAAARGTAVAMVPVYANPTTVFLVGGEVRQLEFGAVTDEVQEQARTWYGADARPPGG
jgi:phosphoglycolate phosphatase-like HAD superfamily hydrolase